MRARPCGAIRLASVVSLLIAATLAAQQSQPAEVVDFTSDRWAITNGAVVEFLGRKAFMGTATLRDVELANGIIELDVAVATDRARSYPGVTFRAQPDGSWERFYIRPHRSALYGDVLQYVAAFNGVDSWQLYNGPGATAPAVVPTGEWLHVRLELSGSQARVFLGPAPEPALVIPRLRHGERKGSVGVMGPADGSAYFSNVSYRSDDGLTFPPPPPLDIVPGIVTEWAVSRPFPAARVDMAVHPAKQDLGELGWAPLSSEPSGLVDVSRLHARSGEPDVVFARAVIPADRDEVRRFDLGYSDAVTVFVNGRPVFSGNSQYQWRDSSFLGVVGWFDSVYAPLVKGDNEILLAVAETSGGWGFMVRDGQAELAADGIVKAWETGKLIPVPESVAFDAARECLYVSGYDPYHPSGAAQGQAIARLGLDGRIDALRWVEGLANPTGLAVAGDRLYAVERRAIAEIDIARAKVVAHHPIPDAKLPNDVAAAADGALFVSDSLRATIYRYANGKVEEWLRDPRLARINGLYVDGSRLVAATNGDSSLKAIDLASREITTLARLGPGIMDGIEKVGEGVFLVSHNEGRLFRVGPNGEVTKLLDLSVVGRNIADFAYVGPNALLVVPTFADNRVVAYTLPQTVAAGR